MHSVYWNFQSVWTVPAGDHARCVLKLPVCMDHPSWWPCTVCTETSSLYGPSQLVTMHSVYWNFQSVRTVPAGDHARCVLKLPVYMDHPSWWPCTVCTETSSLYGPSQLVTIHSVYPYFQSKTAHSLRSIYCLAVSFQLVYRSSSGRLYQNKNINRMCRAVFSAPKWLQYRTAHQWAAVQYRTAHQSVAVQYRTAHQSVAVHCTQCGQRCLQQPHNCSTPFVTNTYIQFPAMRQTAVVNTGQIATDRPTWSLHKATATLEPETT